MAKRFQDILAARFRQFPHPVIIVKNIDGFLRLPEVKALLDLHQIAVFSGSNIAFRVYWELNVKSATHPDDKVLFLSDRPETVLEDIQNESDYCEFQLREFFPEFYLETLLGCHLELLDFLYANKPLRTLGKLPTLKYILEHYYSIDADNFSSKEIVISKWIDFYQKALPIDAPVKDYFLERSSGQLDQALISSFRSFTQYLQEEWQRYGEGQAVSLDFRHPQLKQHLPTYFLNGWLEPADDPTGKCKDVGIPYATRQVSEQYTQEELLGPIRQLLEKGVTVDWSEVAMTVGQVLRHSLAIDQYEGLSPYLTTLNERFQEHLEVEYQDHILPSNSYKRPKVVSKVLDHLKAHYAVDDKVALVVIDGMAWWQYLELKDHFLMSGLQLEEQVLYSWIPSITYLSRQALFRGSMPDPGYIQNPANEEKLWRAYWQDQQVPASRIRYDYQALNSNGLSNLSRLALVYTDLDEKMHASTDYRDLFGLTQNWIIRNRVGEQIQQLTNHGFTVYLTTDHGNIQAKGWRNLRGREKFGAGKSRSRRHLEYAEEWLADEFLDNNPDLAPLIGRTSNTLYLRDDRSFSSQESEVTHGGSHFLEVLVPFVKVNG